MIFGIRHDDDTLDRSQPWRELTIFDYPLTEQGCAIDALDSGEATESVTRSGLLDIKAKNPIVQQNLRQDLALDLDHLAAKHNNYIKVALVLPDFSTGSLVTARKVLKQCLLEARGPEDTLSICLSTICRFQLPLKLGPVSSSLKGLLSTTADAGVWVFEIEDHFAHYAGISAPRKWEAEELEELEELEEQSACDIMGLAEEVGVNSEGRRPFRELVFQGNEFPAGLLPWFQSLGTSKEIEVGTRTLSPGAGLALSSFDNRGMAKPSLTDTEAELMLRPECGRVDDALLHESSIDLGVFKRGLPLGSTLPFSLCTRDLERLVVMAWLKALVALALAAPQAHAILRFPCSQLVTERMDPLVTPGIISPHLHQVIGGNAFNMSMDPSLDIPKLATCTTCRFVEDKSNYWTAVMYFKHPNGSFIRVPQMANHNTGPGLQDGGMTVYYFQPPNNQKSTAFGKGFRMIVGDPMRRSASGVASNSPVMKATTFRCFQGDNIGSSTPGDSPDTWSFPTGTCSGGIRSNLYFPACWDGKNYDSENHSSHVAYPNGGFFGTSCPSTHPVRLPLLFIEIVWDTRPFNDKSLWPSSGQPFVFSMGDPTGYGQHADYLFGWEGDSLQRAMDTCTNGNGIPTDCKVLTVQGMDAMNKCRQRSRVPEVVEASCTSSTST
ncbi:hypothetical protein NMY22_g19838 [Coprinellus aureogranulatus]|nr:hypothetical protein NMY22_g19838 [Coprinellus aureogranulatus]